jgi:hypothetical protein
MKAMIAFEFVPRKKKKKLGQKYLS